MFAYLATWRGGDLCDELQTFSMIGTGVVLTILDSCLAQYQDPETPTDQFAVSECHRNVGKAARMSHFTECSTPRAGNCKMYIGESSPFWSVNELYIIVTKPNKNRGIFNAVSLKQTVSLAHKLGSVWRHQL